MLDLCRVKLKYFLKICHKLITRVTYRHIVKPELNSTQVYDTVMDYVSQHPVVLILNTMEFCQTFVKFHFGKIPYWTST